MRPAELGEAQIGAFVLSPRLPVGAEGDQLIGRIGASPVVGYCPPCLDAYISSVLLSLRICQHTTRATAIGSVDAQHPERQ